MGEVNVGFSGIELPFMEVWRLGLATVGRGCISTKVAMDTLERSFFSDAGGLSEEASFSGGVTVLEAGALSVF